MRQRYTVAGAIAAVILALDLVTKYFAHLLIDPGVPIRVLPFFRLVNVQNRGAAFGMFHSLGNSFFIGVSVGAILLIIYLILRNEMNFVGLSMVLGGALGNLYDRLTLGYVRDFLDFHIAQYHWPAFNVADSALTVGLGIMLIAPFFEKKPPQR